DLGPNGIARDGGGRDELPGDDADSLYNRVDDETGENANQNRRQPPEQSGHHAVDQARAGAAAGLWVGPRLLSAVRPWRALGEGAHRATLLASPRRASPKMPLIRVPILFCFFWVLYALRAAIQRLTITRRSEMSSSTNESVQTAS